MPGTSPPPPTPPAVIALAQQADTAPVRLARYRDRNRVLLFFAPAPRDSALLAEEGALGARPQGVADRDLVVLRVLETGTSTAAGQPLRRTDADALRRRYHAEPGRFTAVLVGKDGHTALRSHTPIVATRLFPLIDAMPMRRIEAAQQRRERARRASDDGTAAHSPNAKRAEP